MKKVLKIIGIVLLAVIVIGGIALKLLGNLPAAPNNYQQTTQTGGEIEAKYMQKGTFEIRHFTVESDDVLQKHLVYYPVELESSDRKYPVIFSLNGTGIAGSKYTAVFEHFASWGFIVLGNEDPSTGFGITADKMYDFIVLTKSILTTSG